MMPQLELQWVVWSTPTSGAFYLWRAQGEHTHGLHLVQSRLHRRPWLPANLLCHPLAVHSPRSRRLAEPPRSARHFHRRAPPHSWLLIPSSPSCSRTPPIGPLRALEVPNRKLGTSPLWHLCWHPGASCHARCHLTRARSQRPLWPFFSLPAPGVARPTPPPALSHPARAHPGPVAALVSSIPLLSYNSTSRLQQKLSPTSRGAETHFHVALREAKSQHCQHSRHSQRPQNYPLYIVTYRRK